MTPQQATEAEFDITEGLRWLGLSASQVDIWMCSHSPNCDGGGVLPWEPEVFGL